MLRPLEEYKRVRKKDKWKCSICRRTFGSEPFLDLHLRRKHPEVFPEVLLYHSLCVCDVSPLLSLVCVFHHQNVPNCKIRGLSFVWLITVISCGVKSMRTKQKLPLARPLSWKNASLSARYIRNDTSQLVMLFLFLATSYFTSPIYKSCAGETIQSKWC